MKHKSDGESPAFPAGVILVDDDSDSEFEDAVTSEITAITVVPVRGDYTDEQELTDGELLPDLSAAVQAADDEALRAGFYLRDRFEIVSLVHSGGMGHVYKAVDHRRHVGGSEQIHVAIKMIRQSIDSRLDADLALEREAAKTQRLSHPNIVNVFDFDKHDDQFYLVMEWLQGESLNALLRRTSGQRLEQVFAWRIVEGIAAGLQYAHSHNVVHADINPSNIFITDTQEIKLLDFGVARYANEANEANDGTVWATRTYASPEVLEGLAPTFEDDIFSLACVAYRLMSGTHPFAGSSSLESKRAGAALPRIPGLAKDRWRVLSRALSFDRSDRPSSASVFFVAAAPVAEPGLIGRLFDRPLPHWWPVLPAVTVVLLAGFWWLSQGGPEIDRSATAETRVADNASGVTAAATIGSLLDQAALAVDEGRFVTPDDDNARDAYRGVLALDPANRGALGGLRTISDVYVQQAIGAMRDDEPIVAIEALAVAKETDAANPAIAVVDDLLLAQGDSLLAKAGLAADDGDAELATALLSEAERYSSVDVDASNALRNQIAKNVQERQFLDRLAIAETHITAGRLLAPSQNNALAALLELKGEREGDSRLQRSMDHLGERLLTRAAFAIAASEFTEATQLLDAADTLGVLTGDIAAAQSSLQRASTRAAVAKAASTKSASLAVQTRSIPESKQETAPPPATSAAAPATLTAATIELPTSEPEASANAKAPTIDVPPQPRTITLSDLAIEKYVAPRFPRSARRRELEGFVEVRFTVNTDGSTGSIETLRAQPGAVFNSSAEKAISQWRFAPRDDVVTTQITLSFALSD